MARILLLLTASAFAQDQAVEQRFEWDGSRTTPVHRIPIFDEFGQQIVPSYEYSLPISTKNTCGTCHTYGVIENGWHFNSSRDVAESGRPGEPWVWVDEQSATQLPLSYREWPGTYQPQEVNISKWRFTQLFARHHPGGDFAEPDADTEVDVDSRWEVSGRAEINCMACHSASPEQDHSEYAKQMARENLRWAATAASGMGQVGGMASRLDPNWTIYDGPDPDDTEFAVVPTVDYDLKKFNDNGWAFFDITHKPPDQNCLQCHSVTPVHAEKWHADLDVHSMAGIRCADCHRNDLEHMIVRGYEGEAKLRKQPELDAFTCRGCHLGPGGHGEASENAAHAVAGTLGAPRPMHKGIPPVHFEKLACTVCHSSTLTEGEPVTVRTSRANRLGIHGRAEWFTDMPHIVEPVYVRNADGVIEPHRMMWPAYWAELNGDEVKPLTPDQVGDAGKGILDGHAQVAALLQTLGNDPDTTGTPLLVREKRAIERKKSGELELVDVPLTNTAEKQYLARLDEGEIRLVVPEFDAASDTLDPETEIKIIRLLQLLEPLAAVNVAGTLRVPSQTREQVVLVRGNKVYRATEESTLESTGAAVAATRTVIVRAARDEAAPVDYEPLLSNAVIDAAFETVGTEFEITEAQVAGMLRRLEEQNRGKRIGYVSSGKLFTLEGDTVKGVEHKAAAPVSWPLGHDVLPAAQSLGIKSCNECHSAEAPYLFATIAAKGPLKTGQNLVKKMHEFQNLDAGYQRLFGTSFKFRSMLKNVLIVTAIIVGAVLALFALALLRRLIAFAGTRRT